MGCVNEHIKTTATTHHNYGQTHVYNNLLHPTLSQNYTTSNKTNNMVLLCEVVQSGVKYDSQQVTHLTPKHDGKVDRVHEKENVYYL